MTGSVARARLAFCLAGPVLLAGGAAPAAAGQTDPVAADTNPADASQATGDSPDIVVTARRRAERIQDTPVSITAFTPELLEDR